MSIKIFNAYRVKGTLDSVYKRLQPLRNEINALQKRVEMEFLCNMSVKFIDDAVISKTSVEHPLRDAWHELIQRQRVVKRDGTNDSAVDNEFSMMLMPHGRFVYCIVYAGHRSLIEFIKKQSWLTPYDYWDNSDPDETVSAREWKKREQVWTAIFAKDDRPSACGLVFEVAPKFSTTHMEDILPLVPSTRRRAELRAKELLRHEYTKARWPTDTANPSTSQIMNLHYESQKWLKSEDGQVALEQKIQDLMLILPTITSEILYEGIKIENMDD